MDFSSMKWYLHIRIGIPPNYIIFEFGRNNRDTRRGNASLYVGIEGRVNARGMSLSERVC